MFGELLRTAAGLYFEDLEEASANAVRREVELLYNGKIGLDAVSRTTIRFLQSRASRLKMAWPPRGGQVKKLTAFGGALVEDTKRAKSRRGKIFKPEFFAPEARRNFHKREAERILLERMRVATFHSTGKEPPKTATYRLSRLSDKTLIGPFARMAQEVFRICERPDVNVGDLMNRSWRASKTRQARL